MILPLIVVQNRRNVEFELADLDVQIREHVEERGVTYYLIELKILAQIWKLKKRYSEFDSLNTTLRKNLGPRIAHSLPTLPPKRFFFNREPVFVQERMKALHKYLKQLILIYEAIESPILQRFLDIDVNFDPNYEYASIDYAAPVQPTARSKRSRLGRSSTSAAEMPNTLTGSKRG